jgi:Cdc6-like AAA superfamily ATPase
MNRELLNRYADFTSAAKLVDLLQKIPNFKVRLTDEEKDVVGCPGNLLVIGRSGTGKTTCAVLRLFAMELLFKLRISLYK